VRIADAVDEVYASLDAALPRFEALDAARNASRDVLDRFVALSGFIALIGSFADVTLERDYT
jgi:hypothetical protein